MRSMPCKLKRPDAVLARWHTRAERSVVLASRCAFRLPGRP